MRNQNDYLEECTHDDSGMQIIWIDLKINSFAEFIDTLHKFQFFATNDDSF
jgi:hypothetical protein